MLFPPCPCAWEERGPLTQAAQQGLSSTGSDKAHLTREKRGTKKPSRLGLILISATLLQIISNWSCLSVGQEIDEDRLPNPLLKPGLSMSPRQRKKVPRTTPTMKELQMMVEHHLCKQQAEEEDASMGSQEPHSPGCCHHGNTDPSHSPGGTCPLAQAKTRLESQEGNHAGPDGKEESTGACAKSEDNGRPGLSSEKQSVHILPKDSSGGALFQV
ncbi:protein phosphatase 1 regulatory subunit 1A isoform X2 [Mauremys reevesii]|uniref:protein phosphatase 1 regulatory subunit 1A isoform X2 n=1 Tax=Mauremys reevesii TaxID=260615 RepID=UPI00193FB285|nr:protein phosphatase 1 regulatory subunit 1A isoform X2 [Mauremys reevesii]